MLNRLQCIAMIRIPALRAASGAFRSWLHGALHPTRSGGWALLAGLLVVGLAAIAAQSWWAALWVHEHLWEVPAESLDDILEDLGDGHAAGYWLGLTAAVLATGIELLVFYLVWVRMRARRVLARRERCAFCGHDLSGTPVAADASVICPECSRATPAVEKWDEILREGDRSTFRPAAGVCTTFWTRRRVVLAAKCFLVLGVLAGAAYGGWWTIREVGIRREAAQARADRLGVEALNAKLREEVLPHREGVRLVDEVIAKIAVRIRKHTDEFVKARSLDTGLGGDDLPDASYISFRPTETDPKVQRTIAQSADLVEWFRSQGLFGLVDELVSASPWTATRVGTIDNPAAPSTRLGDYRKALRVCLARMKLAHDAGDVSEFERGFASAAAIVRAAGSGPLLIDWLVANYGQSSVLQSGAAVLSKRPERPWVEAVKRGILPMQPVPLLPTLDREELLDCDSVAWYFSDPNRARKGIHADELDESFGLSMVGTVFGTSGDQTAKRLGSYGENVREIRGFYAMLRSHAKVEPWIRRTLPPLAESSDLVIANAVVLPVARTLRSRDETALRFGALRAMIVLELWRLDHGEYPDDLEGCSRAELPLDPFSGKMFGYRRIDASTDRFGRGYLLWTVGFDGTDQGGQDNDRWRDAALRPAGSGSDMILNDPRW